MQPAAIARTLATVLAVAPLAGATVEAAAADVALGQRLFAEGVNARGEPVRALIGRPPVPIAGESAACVRCHHAGVADARVAELRWASLAQDDDAGMSGLRPRSAYAERSFARAVTEGFDPRGVPLPASMPRYSLSRAEMDALIAYLRTL